LGERRWTIARAVGGGQGREDGGWRIRDRGRRDGLGAGGRCNTVGQRRRRRRGGAPRRRYAPAAVSRWCLASAPAPPTYSHLSDAPPYSTLYGPLSRYHSTVGYTLAAAAAATATAGGSAGSRVSRYALEGVLGPAAARSATHPAHHTDRSTKGTRGKAGEPSRPSPLRTGRHGGLAAGQKRPFAKTHQKSAGAGPVLDRGPLHAKNECEPVRRIYKRRKSKADLKKESHSIHWGCRRLWALDWLLTIRASVNGSINSG